MDTLLNPALTDDLIDRLMQIWTAVGNDGGAMGFVGDVTTEDVIAEVAHYWSEVRDKNADLVVVSAEGRPVGFGFLIPAEDPRVAGHRAEIRKVQRDPASSGAGVGAMVVAGLEVCARARGVSLVTLTVRGETGAEGFYAGNGYATLARLPGWLQINEVPTEAVVMAKWLDPSRQAAGSSVVEAPLQVKVRRLDPDLPLPSYARPGDAGLDLMAREDCVLPAGRRCLMPTGIAVAIPSGYVGLVHPRSGLAIRQGLSVINTPGTIDAGYRGELKVPLVNHDHSVTVRIARGERIAQLLIQRVEHAHLVEVDELPDGIRGEGGFGSTGR